MSENFFVFEYLKCFCCTIALLWRKCETINVTHIYRFTVLKIAFDFCNRFCQVTSCLMNKTEHFVSVWWTRVWEIVSNSFKNKVLITTELNIFNCIRNRNSPINLLLKDYEGTYLLPLCLLNDHTFLLLQTGSPSAKNLFEFSKRLFTFHRKSSTKYRISTTFVKLIKNINKTKTYNCIGITANPTTLLFVFK